jgi:hypothetical protein
MVLCRHYGTRATRRTIMTTPSDPRTSVREEWPGKLQPGAGTTNGNGPSDAVGRAAERTGTPYQNAGPVTEHTAAERATAPHGDEESPRSRGAPLGGARGFAALEGDFRSHHHTTAVRRHSPYKYYRVVYRYGYDLGVNSRYRSAEWADVEREARPRWEERNPDTWVEFQDMIRYAWDMARQQVLVADDQAVRRQP